MKKLLTKMECEIYRMKLHRKELPKVDEECQQCFHNRVRHILMASGYITFAEVVMVTDVMVTSMTSS